MLGTADSGVGAAADSSSDCAAAMVAASVLTADSVGGAAADGSSARAAAFAGSTCLEPLIAAVAQQQMAAAPVQQLWLQHAVGTADSGGGAAADGSSARAAALPAAHAWNR